MEVQPRMAMDSDQRPTSILASDPLAPRPPWSFLTESLPGGFTRWGWGLMLGWILVLLGPVLGWAGFLRRAVGSSALPSHWGEGLAARDLWELWQNGGLQHRLVNSPTVHLFGLGLVIVLWCGWRLQAESVGLKARLGPWLLGGLDTLLLGPLPIGLVAWGLDRSLAWAGNSGLESLGWLALVGRPLLWMAAAATLNLQWWLFRLGRLRGLDRGFRRHLTETLVQLWGHPTQWALLTLGAVILRSGLPFCVLLLAWRLGGGTILRVVIFLALQLLVTALNGWFMGWLLRATAFYSRQAAAVAQASASLKDLPSDEAAV